MSRERLREYEAVHMVVGRDANLKVVKAQGGVSARLCFLIHRDVIDNRSY